MADARFFTSAGPFSVAALTEKNGIEARDDDLLLSGVASLSAADSNSLSFFSDLKLQDTLAATKAGAVLVKAEHAALVPSGSLALICDDPYRSMAEITQMFFPAAAQSRPPQNAIADTNIHPSPAETSSPQHRPNKHRPLHRICFKPDCTNAAQHKQHKETLYLQSVLEFSRARPLHLFQA